MPTAHIAYLGNLRTEATHLQSGTAILTDAPTDNHGKGECFSPTDLLATSLGACIITTMGIVAQRDGVELKGAKIDVTKVMTATGQRKIQKIEISIRIDGHNIAEDYRQKMLNTAHTCPVALSLHPDVQQDITLIWQ